MLESKSVRKDRDRFHVLDGWRGISILLVLAAHLLPLGPKSWLLNSTAGPMGMSLFFTLSGFLMTKYFVHNTSITNFLIRRFFRIIPLAWLYIMIVLFLTGDNNFETLIAQLFFYANWPPMQFTDETGHFWSLCVEMQFYVGLALLISVLKGKGLFVLPLICIAITLYRIESNVLIAINTYYRVDEILAGGILALIFYRKIPINFIGECELPVKYYLGVVLAFVISCHPESGFMNYMRPYFGATLIGLTLYDRNKITNIILSDRSLAYLASISFALYVIHMGLISTWLGEGETVEKYIKRPLFFLVLFVLAHISSFYYENRCITLGKRFSKLLLRNK